MTEFLLLLILIVVATVGWTLYKSKNQAKAGSSTSPPSRPVNVDPLANWSASGGDEQFFALKPGDLVKTDQHDFLVRGTITMDDSGTEWWTHLLDDATGTKRWLSVENEDGLEMGFWDRVPVSDIESGSPGDRSIVLRGIAYKLIERGNANYRATGTTSTQPAGHAEYMDYEAADGRMLSLERFDEGGWEASVGEKVLPSELSVYPSNTSAQG